jgi:hypothetical protein
MILNLLEQDASRVCDAVSLSPLRGKSILITGASGLLGTHYISCLRQLQLADSAKMKIYAVIASEPESYFKKLCNFPGMEIIQQDLTHPEFQNNLQNLLFLAPRFYPSNQYKLLHYFLYNNLKDEIRVGADLQIPAILSLQQFAFVLFYSCFLYLSEK